MRLSSHAIPGTGGHTSRTGVKGLFAGATALALVGGGASVVMAANPPIGPGNIEIFTKRDMVAIEGYSAQAGQDATITVTRGGSVIGVARGVVDSTGFLEVNHPGGVCWDAITPNITGQDTVNVEFEDDSSDGAIAGTAEISSVDPVNLPATADTTDAEHQVVVKGTYGGDVNTSRMAVEIVNPDMRTTGIGERAIGWPTDDTPTGYTVNGELDNNAGTFTVTYGFYSEAERDLALAGDPSVASWQAEPVGVEAQLGLTISEFKEIDGPGFGGCPAGPGGQAPNAPTDVFASASSAGSITATWTPATVPADAPAITGYQVIAEDSRFPKQEVSVKVGETATSGTIHGLVPGQVYPVKVVALNGQASAAVSAGEVTVGSADAAPATRPSPPGDVKVTAGSMAGTADVSWAPSAPNGSAITGYRVEAKSGETVAKTTTVSGEAVSAALEGLTVETTYDIYVTAINAVGETSTGPVPFTATQPSDLSAPSAPKIVRVTAGNGSATVEWQPATADNTPITGYVLTAESPAGTTVKEVKTDAAGRSAVLTELTNNTTYALKLVATSAAGPGPAATSTVTPADQLTATAQYRSDDNEWRIGGTASVTANNTITATNANGVRIGTATVLADGSWTMRVRNSTTAATPTITVKSSAGGSITVSVSTR